MQAPTSKPSTASLPPENVRGFISLLLIIHLFAITVALSSYVAASLIQRQLASTLRPYLRTFNFELTHVFPAVSRLHLTHSGPFDVDFRVSGTADTPDGTRPWELPRKGLFPPIRYQRDQTLANVAGALIETQSEEMETLLPRALAAAELRKAGAQKGSITVTAHYLQEFEDRTAPEVHRRDPFDPSYYRDVFDAKAIANSMGGVDLLKSAAKGEVAPVTGASGRTSKTSPTQ